MDYEGYTFVFKKHKHDFFIKKWYILCFYFSTVEKSFKMQVTYICLNKIKGQ